MKKEIIKKLHEFDLSGHPLQEVFYDWLELSTISIANAVETSKKLRDNRENKWLSIAKKYTSKEFERFPELFALLEMGLEERMCDMLGEIYMEAGISSDRRGQFFTPYHISQLMARLAYKPNVTRIHEPACGSGASVIAVGELLKSKGINYQRQVSVVAQDLDWTCVYMCYVQLALLGFRGCVVQGDTLSEPYQKGITPPERIFWLPSTFLP